jgi:hypothetical protein
MHTCEVGNTRAKIFGIRKLSRLDLRVLGQSGRIDFLLPILICSGVIGLGKSDDHGCSRWTML